MSGLIWCCIVRVLDGLKLKRGGWSEVSKLNLSTRNSYRVNFRALLICADGQFPMKSIVSSAPQACKCCFYRMFSPYVSLPLFLPGFKACLDASAFTPVHKHISKVLGLCSHFIHGMSLACQVNICEDHPHLAACPVPEVDSCLK